VVGVLEAQRRRAQHGRLGTFAEFVVRVLDVQVLDPFMVEGSKVGSDVVVEHDDVG